MVGWIDRQKNELRVPSSVGGGVESSLEAKEEEEGCRTLLSVALVLVQTGDPPPAECLKLTLQLPHPAWDSNITPHPTPGFLKFPRHHSSTE